MSTPSSQQIHTSQIDTYLSDVNKEILAVLVDVFTTLPQESYQGKIYRLLRGRPAVVIIALLKTLTDVDFDYTEIFLITEHAEVCQYIAARYGGDLDNDKIEAKTTDETKFKLAFLNPIGQGSTTYSKWVRHIRRMFGKRKDLIGSTALSDIVESRDQLEPMTGKWVIYGILQDDNTITRKIFDTRQQLDDFKLYHVVGYKYVYFQINTITVEHIM